MLGISAGEPRHRYLNIMIESRPPFRALQKLDTNERTLRGESFE